MKAKTAMLWLLLLSVLAIGGGLVFGSGTSANELFHGDATAWQIVNQLRAPRVFSAFGVGVILTIAGALMQVLLRNPLADPYVLGISGGAGVAVLLGILLGIDASMRPLCAWLGAAAALALIGALGRQLGNWEPGRLILIGAVLSSFWVAITNIILIVSPDSNLHSMLFWLIGDLASAQQPWLLCSVAALACLFGARYGHHLDILQLGDDQASALGLDVRPTKWLAYVATSLLTAIAVSYAGSVGFVGLIVPHLIRMLGIRRHAALLVTAGMAGGSLLVIADTLGRTLVAPMQLPVGIFTALIGAPTLLYLLRLRTRGTC